MVVKLRLSRFGNKHSPFYNIVVAQARYVPLTNAEEMGKKTKRNQLLIPFLSFFTETEFFRSARDSKPLEVIGTYNPIPQKPTNLSDEEARNAKPYKAIELDQSRAKYWLGVGAQPSDTVWRLLSMVCPGNRFPVSAIFCIKKNHLLTVYYYLGRPR
jgi:small subunit ribosomal protein S16